MFSFYEKSKWLTTQLWCLHNIVLSVIIILQDCFLLPSSTTSNLPFVLHVVLSHVCFPDAQFWLSAMVIPCKFCIQYSMQQSNTQYLVMTWPQEFKQSKLHLFCHSIRIMHCLLENLGLLYSLQHQLRKSK